MKILKALLAASLVACTLGPSLLLAAGVEIPTTFPKI